MNIYSCIDSKNIEKVLILFYSIIVNSPSNKFKFFIITDKFNDINIPINFKDRIFIKELMIDQRWRKLIDNFNENFYKDVPWCKSDMNFARFFIFEHFPQINRAIYLDWDMIVVSDIKKLLKFYNDTDKIIVSSLEIEQSILNSSFTDNFKHSRNINSIYLQCKKEILKLHDITKVLDNLNIIYDDIIKNQSFNAGFFIVSRIHFDIDYLFSFIETLIKEQISKNCFKFGTQTILNLMFINDRYFIEKEWNYIPNINENCNIEKANIIHWNGSNKPWKNKSSINKIWWHYHDNYKKYINQNQDDFNEMNI